MAPPHVHTGVSRYVLPAVAPAPPPVRAQQPKLAAKSKTIHPVGVSAAVAAPIPNVGIVLPAAEDSLVPFDSFLASYNGMGMFSGPLPPLPTSTNFNHFLADVDNALHAADDDYATHALSPPASP